MPNLKAVPTAPKVPKLSEPNLWAPFADLIGAAIASRIDEDASAESELDRGEFSSVRDV